MRLDKLTLHNFRGFQDRNFSLHPRFNLVIGENASGKSTLFHAAAVALDICLRHLAPHADDRVVDARDVRRVRIDVNGRMTIEPQLPTSVRVEGQFLSKESHWWEHITSDLPSDSGLPGESSHLWSKKTNSTLRVEGQTQREAVQRGEPVDLPLMGVYEAGRLWAECMEREEPSESESMSMSRFEGYRGCLHATLSKQALNRWIFKEYLKKLQGSGENWAFQLVEAAIMQILPGSKQLLVVVDLTQAAIEFENGNTILLDDLSDGQRTMVTLVGDLARRSITLNPHMGTSALLNTEGVVLIDELDLHLHPKWQRRVIDDLRRIFPKIQFLCTTHAPLLIQSVPAEEIIALDNDLPTDWEGENSVEDILEEVQGVTMPQRSQKSERWTIASKRYFSLLSKNGNADPAALAAAELEYREASEPFTDNPTINAILRLEAMAQRPKP